MVVAKIAAMANERPISGKNCPARAITASVGTTRASGVAIGLCLVSLLVHCTTTRAQTSLTNGGSASGLTNVNGVGSTNGLGGVIYLPSVSGPESFLAINGPGYFVTRDPASGALSATRYGPFMVDTLGFLTTFSGSRVEGYNNPALTVIGDVQVNGGGFPTTNGLYLASYVIETNGLIVETFSDGSSNVCGQILLQNFQDPSALTAQGWQFYGWDASAGPLAQAAPPGTSGTGTLLIGTLEQLTPKLQLSRYSGPPETFRQGVLVSTGVPADVGIEGEGFFVLRRTNDNTLFATRAGAFYLDGSGYMVHYSGMRLEGYTDSALTSIGDVQIEPTCSPSASDPGAYAEDFGIDQHGVITEQLSDGTSIVRGQILLEGCSNPNLIAHTNFDLYPLVTYTGLWSRLAAPLSGDLGWLVQGTVELSQFDESLLAVRSNLNFFSEGPIMPTGVPSNLGILGPGFFTVRDPVANTLYATCLGDFQLDADGYLATTNGLRVQGISNYNTGRIGDISIDSGGIAAPSVKLTNYAISMQGNIAVFLSDGTSFSRGQVLLQAYRNPQGLRPEGNGLYSNVAAAVPMFTNGQPGVGLGMIQSGAVEEPPPPPPTLQLPPASGFRLFVTDLTIGNVESSGDLLHWSVIGQVDGSPDLNVGEFFDTPQTTRTFYRIAIPTY
jgi:flagellar hook protein FlgE